MKFWNRVDDGVFVSTYIFRGNPINTVAFSIGEGRLLVVGPGIETTEESFAELDSLGQVVAIASPGPFHHLGFPKWASRYKAAKLFAAKSGVERIPAQHKNTTLVIHPMDDLQAMLPSTIRVQDTPGMKHADIFVVVTNAQGQVSWMTNEVLTNIKALPGGLFGLLFKVTGNGTGIGVNTLSGMLVGMNKKVTGEFFRSQLREHTPYRLIPSHGDVVEGDSIALQIRAQVDAKLA